MNHSLRREKPRKPRKMMSAQGGRNSKSLRDGKLTTHVRQHQDKLQPETGRIRFRGVRFQTPNSVISSGLTEFRGSELSEFLFSAYYLCAKATPSVSQNSPSLPQNSVRLSEFSSPKQYSRNSIPPVSYSAWNRSWRDFLEVTY